MTAASTEQQRSSGQDKSPVQQAASRSTAVTTVSDLSMMLAIARLGQIYHPVPVIELPACRRVRLADRGGDAHVVSAEAIRRGASSGQSARRLNENLRLGA